MSRHVSEDENVDDNNNNDNNLDSNVEEEPQEEKKNGNDKGKQGKKNKKNNNSIEVDGDDDDNDDNDDENEDDDEDGSDNDDGDENGDAGQEEDDDSNDDSNDENTATENNKQTKKSRGRGRRRGNGNRGQDNKYRVYIFKVLKQVHPEIGITKKGMNIVNSFVEDMFEKICNESMKLCSFSKNKSTISAREIETAAKLILPGELEKHAILEGKKAVETYKKNYKQLKEQRKEHYGDTKGVFGGGKKRNQRIKK